MREISVLAMEDTRRSSQTIWVLLLGVAVVDEILRRRQHRLLVIRRLRHKIFGCTREHIVTSLTPVCGALTSEALWSTIWLLGSLLADTLGSRVHIELLLSIFELVWKLNATETWIMMLEFGASDVFKHRHCSDWLWARLYSYALTLAVFGSRWPD